jgi:hypothetical protein
LLLWWSFRYKQGETCVEMFEDINRIFWIYCWKKLICNNG